MDSPIPSVWRIWFATLDPLVALSGVYLNCFNPTEVLNSYSPKAVSPPAIETRVLLDTSSGFLLGTMFLQVVLLRLKSKDVTVWKCLQASIAIVDVAIITSILMALNTQGRVDPSQWRVQETGSLGLTAFVLTTRVLFLLGVGMPQLNTNNMKWE
jgi:hypothetical protein